MTGLTGQDDASIENAHTVGDIQTICIRAFDQNHHLCDDIVQMQARHDVGMAQMCVDMRQVQQDFRQVQADSHHGPQGTKFDLVYVRSMSPSLLIYGLR